jgi:hypothetical protein
VLSYRQHAAFHGTLSLHPACKTWIDVNFDNVTTIKLLKSVAAIASDIMVQRDVAKFVNLALFKAFCSQKDVRCLPRMNCAWSQKLCKHF